jgi:hypothetical protein
MLKHSHYPKKVTPSYFFVTWGQLLFVSFELPIFKPYATANLYSVLTDWLILDN